MNIPAKRRIALIFFTDPPLFHFRKFEKIGRERSAGIPEYLHPKHSAIPEHFAWPPTATHIPLIQPLSEVPLWQARSHQKARRLASIYAKLPGLVKIIYPIS